MSFKNLFSQRRQYGINACGTKPGKDAIKKQEGVVNSLRDRLLKGDKSVNAMVLQKAVNVLIKTKEDAKKSCEGDTVYHCVRGKWICVPKWMIKYRHDLKTSYDNITRRYGHSPAEFMNIVGLSDLEIKLLLDMSMNSFWTMPTILNYNQIGILSLGAFGQAVAQAAESAKKEALVEREKATKQISDQVKMAKTSIALSVDKRLRASVFDYNIVHSQEAKDRRIKSINDSMKSLVKRYEKDLSGLMELAEKIRSKKGMNVDISDKIKKMREIFKIRKDKPN